MYTAIPAQLQLQLSDAPKKPGVYMFRNSQNELVYIGKAVNLFNRSRSYFANYKRLDPRLQLMVEQAASVEYIEVENEVEALLLEANLIKKYDPRYNILLTDDKSYIWVKVYSQMDFPIVRIVRSKKDDKADYFGPFPAKAPIKRMLKQMRSVFPNRSCDRVIEERPVAELSKALRGMSPEQRQELYTKYTAAASEGNFIYSSDRKPCLYFHLGLCDAPCTGELSKQTYRSNINGLKRFFRSEHQELKDELNKQMQTLAKNQEFEKAAEVRNKLRDLEYLTEFTRISEDVDEHVLAQRKLEAGIAGLAELVDKIAAPEFSAKYDKELPEKKRSANLAQFKMECYDISNIQGTNAVAAMTVSVGGKLRKDLYRKFKIQSKDTPDDFAMLQETLERRLRYLLPNAINNSDDVTEDSVEKVQSEAADVVKKVDESFAVAPDLIVIDGGKGQLSSVVEILKPYEEKLGYKIPVIGLAKKHEEVFVPEEESQGKSSFRLIKLSRRSNSLRLLQAVRDEAHRFGIGYHRLLRSKGMIYSELDLIPGVGNVTKKRLLLAFGSVAGIKKAKIEEIESVVKNRATAAKIKKFL